MRRWRRAFIEFPTLSSRMAWDGEKAWSENWELPYIVTYASVLPEGKKATPPNILLYEEHAVVDGLVVPVRAEIFRKEGHVPFATVRLRDWSFSKPFDASRLVMPPGATVDRSRP